MRSPVDLHLAVFQPVAPFAQRGRRQMQGGGVLQHAHPAPVHRLDVHRPERLEGGPRMSVLTPKRKRARLFRRFS